MKSKSLVLLIYLLSIYSSCQNKTGILENKIKKSFTTFFENMKEKKFDSAVEFIYPKYFEIVSKEKMIQILHSTYNNPSIQTEIQEFEISNIEENVKIDDKYYSIINYIFHLKLKVDWDSFPNSQQLQLTNGLNKKYGNENVKYFSDEDYYIINAKMKACAISNDQNDWTFLIETLHKQEIQTILPEKIYNKF